MTLAELEADVYRRLGKNTTADTVTQTRIRAFLNQRHRRLLSEVGIGQLREEVFTFASVASQQRYALPQGVAKVHRIWEETNDRHLTEMTLAQLRQGDPSPASGTPDHWVPFGYTAVAQQPSAAALLFAKSTSASDTQAITIEGMLSTGERRTVTTSLTGVTALDVGATLATWLTIERVYLITAAIGTVTLHQTNGTGTELARITLGLTAPRYYSILLYPTPASAITYSIDASFEINDMSVAGDVPYLPPDFHYLIVTGVRIDEYEKTDDDRYVKAMVEWVDGIKKLKWYLYGERGQEGASPAYSTLGPWYPRERMGGYS